MAARARRAIAASIAPAVAEIVRSAEAQHITAQMIAPISARAAPSMPCELAASARMNATAPAHIANAIARLLSENPSTCPTDPHKSPGPPPEFRSGTLADKS